MEAWDIIVLGDGPAALRAASTAAESGTSVLMMSIDSLGSGHGASTDGIAAPIKESTMKSHSDDTIRAGNFLCDQDIVTQRISLACRQVDLLERWGPTCWKRSHRTFRPRHSRNKFGRKEKSRADISSE